MSLKNIDDYVTDAVDLTYGRRFGREMSSERKDQAIKRLNDYEEYQQLKGRREQLERIFGKSE